MQNDLRPKNIIILTDWVFQSLTRNKFNLSEMNNYKKFRSIISLDDMTDFVYLNKNLTLHDSLLSQVDLDNYFIFTSDEERSEFFQIIASARGDTIEARVKSRLSRPYNGPDDDTHKFIHTGSDVILVLSEGLLNIKSEKDFVHKYLESCYQYFPIQEVSKFNIFPLYLHHLK